MTWISKSSEENIIKKQLTITKSCRTETLFGHENLVPPEGDTEAEHHALIFFFLDFYLWVVVI